MPFRFGRMNFCPYLRVRRRRCRERPPWPYLLAAVAAAALLCCMPQWCLCLLTAAAAAALLAVCLGQGRRW